MPYLSSMLGKRIIDMEGVELGRLEDLLASSEARFPVVEGISAMSGYMKRRRRFFIPWELVQSWEGDYVLVNRPFDECPPPSEAVRLAEDLLDKQIVDMDGYKIVRVTDIRLARSGGNLRVIGADVGLLSILRRLGLGFLARQLHDRNLVSDRIVPWNLMYSVDPVPYDVRLRVPYRKFQEIHPSDIADIIEQLEVEQRSKIMALIDNPKAAQVLVQVVPSMKSSVSESVGDVRLSELLDIMPPDEAAEILRQLPREKARLLLKLMGIEGSYVVGELLGYDPDTAGGIMTTEFVAIPKAMTANQTIDYLRTVGKEPETIYYVFVVDAEGHLSGVLSLRDLLRAAPEARVEDLMTRDVITADIQDDQEEVAYKLTRYNLLALPVVDSNHELKGIVTYDDAIDVFLEEATEDISQISGVELEAEEPLKEVFGVRRWGGITLTFLGGILGTALFGMFRNSFIAALALVYFVPLALRAAHDVSIWSVTSAVRDIERGEFTGLSLGRTVAREYAYAVVASAIISILAFSASLVWTDSLGHAFAGSLGLFVGVAVAGMIGMLISVVIRKEKPHPAVGPGRMAGLVVMIVTVICFLVVSGLLVGSWG